MAGFCLLELWPSFCEVIHERKKAYRHRSVLKRWAKRAGKLDGVRFRYPVSVDDDDVRLFKFVFRRTTRRSPALRSSTWSREERDPIRKSYPGTVQL